MHATPIDSCNESSWQLLGSDSPNRERYHIQEDSAAYLFILKKNGERKKRREGKLKIGRDLLLSAQPFSIFAVPITEPCSWKIFLFIFFKKQDYHLPCCFFAFGQAAGREMLIQFHLSLSLSRKQFQFSFFLFLKDKNKIKIKESKKK